MKNNIVKYRLPGIVFTIASIIMTSSVSALVVSLEDLPTGSNPLAISDPGCEWHGNDIFENNPPEYTHTATESSFTSNGFLFNNIQDHYTEEWYGTVYEFDSWDGWAYSNRCDIDTAGLPGQFTAMGSGVMGENGAQGSAQYAIASIVDSYSTLHFDTGQTLKSAYLTNCAYAYHSMNDGDSYAKKFGGKTGDDDDWFMLTITGKNAEGGITGSVDFYLADFQFGNNAEDYIVDSWTEVDLTPLGDNIRSVEFALDSSDFGTFGVNTPKYFAIDNISFSTIPGDANLDGAVDGLDAAILALNWQIPSGACWSQGDFDANGTVDGADATILAANWRIAPGGDTPPTVSVPEPGAFAMLLGSLCIYGVVIVRRKDASA